MHKVSFPLRKFQSTELQLSSTGTGATSSRTLLDQPMGLKCLAGLLGIGQARLRRATTCTPDLRFGKKEHRFKAGTWSADAFFQIAYDSLAETLPDQFPVIQLFMTQCFAMTGH